MLIDTHCHLDFKDFDKDRDDVLKRAGAEGVRYIINIGSSPEGSKRSLELADKYDEVFASLGIHPHDAPLADEKMIAEFRRMAQHKKVVAIGEVGLDYYKCESPKDIQKDAFRRFIRLAVECDLPLVIHNRDADLDALSILKEETGGKIKGVMHCFSGNPEFLGQCLRMGLFVSFTCNVTFKNAKLLRLVLADVPLEKLLLETDAPFLAPQAFRGQRNEPSYLKYLAEEISKVKNIPREKIEEVTTENAIHFFGLDRI
ncbi:MAG: TatD family hydrolase [Candidatus Omnitrophota bacterium]